MDQVGANVVPLHVVHKAACQTLLKAFLKSMKILQRSCAIFFFFFLAFIALSEAKVMSG